MNKDKQLEGSDFGLTTKTLDDRFDNAVSLSILTGTVWGYFVVINGNLEVIHESIINWMRNND